MNKFLLLFLTIYSSKLVNSANILGVFPTPSVSHQIVFHALMKDLAARGHHVTVLTTDLIKTDNPNMTQIDLHGSYDVFRKVFNFVEFKESQDDEYGLMKYFLSAMYAYKDFQLSHPDVKKIIAKPSGAKFDVLITEYFYNNIMLAFAEVYDCPIIAITSLETPILSIEEFGNEANPVIHPENTFSPEHGALTFYERFRSLKYYLKFKWLLEFEMDRDGTKVIRKHFPTVTASISDMKKRIAFLMTNSNPAMGFIRPLVPNTIQLGFMHIQPPKPLPAGDLKTFLDSSKNGVIYVSFGSNVQSKDFSDEIKQVFLKVFGSLSYDVVWKFEADDLPNKPDNVMISKWLPQSDLMAHPKIKLFITQGGQQSLEEAIDRTLPMIVIPFLGDQNANAKLIVRKEIGLQLELLTLTESKFLSTINEMMKPKYKQNVVKLRELVYDQPMTSRERAVWWTEYVIRHKGAKHLEYLGKNVPFYQRYWLDFIGILLATLFVTFIIASKIIKSIFKVLKSKRD